jgi:suppressor of ftsI
MMNSFRLWRAAALGTGVAALIVFGIGTMNSSGQEALGPPLLQPTIVSASRGVVELTLEAAPSSVTVAGRSFVSNVYNGQYTPPLFRLRRGEELHLRLVNRIGPGDVQIDDTQATNLHYHGMSVSPKPPADDIYITIPSLEMIQNPASVSHTQHQMVMRDDYIFDYRWRAPEDHAQGPFWYHSHAHGQAEPQVLSGLSGLFLIDGFIDDWYPWLSSAQERFLLLKDIEFPGADDDAPKSKTINGQLNPTITLTRGEAQIWNIGNVGADAFFDIEIEGMAFWVLSRDGNALERPVEQRRLFIPPGARYTVFVNGFEEGRFRLVSRNVDTGPQGDPNPEVRLGTVVVGPRQMGQPAGPVQIVPGLPLPTRRGDPSAVDALLKMPIAARRTVTFSESADGNSFFINDQQWSPDRDDTVTQVGAVEEWTVRNVTGEHHVFHIHQVDFLVTATNGSPADAMKILDTINVPYSRNGVPGEVKLIMPFLPDRIEGRFVYHCHILEHEDGGMMANILVRPRPN